MTTLTQQKIMQARLNIQQIDPIIGAYAARYTIVSATKLGVDAPQTFTLDEDGIQIVYNDEWVQEARIDDITDAIIRQIIDNPPSDEIRDAAARLLPQQTYPIQDVFDGTYSKVGFDETTAWSHVFLGMLMQELIVRAARMRERPNWRDLPTYTAWLTDADNFLQFLMDNYRPEETIMASRYLISEQRLPFNPNRMPTFNRLSSTFLKLISGA